MAIIATMGRGQRGSRPRTDPPPRAMLIGAYTSITPMLMGAVTQQSGQGHLDHEMDLGGHPGLVMISVLRPDDINSAGT